MAEFIAKVTVVVADGGPAVDTVVRIPPAFGRWTLIAVPIDSGGADPISLSIYYRIGDTWYPSNPPGSATNMTLNQANVVTRNDLVSDIRVRLTPGATAPDGNVDLSLSGVREG